RKIRQSGKTLHGIFACTQISCRPAARHTQRDCSSSQSTPIPPPPTYPNGGIDGLCKASRCCKEHVGGWCIETEFAASPTDTSRHVGWCLSGHRDEYGRDNGG